MLYSNIPKCFYTLSVGTIVCVHRGGYALGFKDMYWKECESHDQSEIRNI